MIILLLLVNFGISWLNAWVCGNTWDSASIKGGVAYFMNWMGAIMSACGFTWCYLVGLAFVGAVLPLSLFTDDPEVSGYLLDERSLQAVLDLGYLAIVFPILGSGMAITVQTWREFARKRQRTTTDYGLVGWNTFAQTHNAYEALYHVPRALGRTSNFFGTSSSSSSSSDDPKGAAGLLVLLLVVAALCGGILTTYGIIQARRRDVRMEDYSRLIEDKVYA